MRGCVTKDYPEWLPGYGINLCFSPAKSCYKESVKAGS